MDGVLSDWRAWRAAILALALSVACQGCSSSHASTAAEPLATTLREPSGSCLQSPTHRFLQSVPIANNRAPLTASDSPCSGRYTLAWSLDLEPADIGRPAVDVLAERYGALMAQNAVYIGRDVNTPDIKDTFTIDIGPGGRLALQRNVEPGIVPSSAFSFRNFPDGREAICIAVDVFVPEGLVGNEAGGGKLGYGIWGGAEGARGAGGVSPLQQEAFSVRNVAAGGSLFRMTRLYSYHLNRGADGRWASGREQPYCDASACCLYGDASDGGRISPGRWVTIEEEVVLNDPGIANGTSRLWIDGTQVGEIAGQLFRLAHQPDLEIKGLAINDMWGGSITNEKNQARAFEKYWLGNYKVYE